MKSMKHIVTLVLITVFLSFALSSVFSLEKHKKLQCEECEILIREYNNFVDSLEEIDIYFYHKNYQNDKFWMNIKNRNKGALSQVFTEDIFKKLPYNIGVFQVSIEKNGIKLMEFSYGMDNKMILNPIKGIISFENNLPPEPMNTISSKAEIVGNEDEIVVLIEKKETFINSDICISKVIILNTEME